ncbi:hypothetical protein KKC74_12625, partial [bacterium]|nr:hypothetical protein [bacterium]
MKWITPIVLIVICIMLSCSPRNELKPPTNPYDPDNPDYELPHASVIGEVDYGEVIDTSAVTIIWQGNETAYEFSYRYDLDIVETDWSVWTRDTSVTLRYLDEGNYQFDIKARTNQTVPVEGDANSFHFSVDAVKGPAVRCFPIYQSISVGQESEIEIIAEEVDSLMGAEVHLTFNPAIIRVKSVAYSPFLYEDLANGVSFKEIDNVNGTVDMVVVRSSGSKPTVSGTGTIAILEIEALSAGTADIEISSSVFKDQNNDE